MQKAIALQPTYPNPRMVLGLVRYQQGRFREAIASFQEARKILPQNHPWKLKAQTKITECKRWSALEQKLPSVLAKTQNVSGQQQFAMIILCVRYKKRYRDAVKLSKELFQRDPTLDGGFNHQLPYIAACAAALGASGKGSCAKDMRPKERKNLLIQARTWLQADLKVCQDSLKRNRFDAGLIVARTQHWQRNPEFTTLRDRKVIASLPKNERQAFQKLWSDVKALEKSARSLFTETQMDGTLDANHVTHEHKMTAGKTYLILMRSKQFDTFLRLEDSQRNKLAENDDVSKIDRSSRIIFTPKTTGSYRLIATSFQQRGRGEYEIVIREFPKQPKD